VLFLDYDGTLANFSKYPDVVKLNPVVVQLIKALLACENITPIIISGRRLAQLQKLVPILNMILAGTYGLEIQFPNNEIYYPLKYETIRPALEEIKPVWGDLIEKDSSFFLEDKGWSLAIHARFVDEGTAEKILLAAQKAARSELDSAVFQVKAGYKFLEVSPVQANKGKCVKFLIDKIPTENAALIYMGDDDKDEQAFEVVQSYGGVAIRVCSNVINSPIEDWRLDDPKAAREWLWNLTKGCS
jgi:trehalose 6-phosphate phosphatase